MSGIDNLAHRGGKHYDEACYDGCAYHGKELTQHTFFYTMAMGNEV